MRNSFQPSAFSFQIEAADDGRGRMNLIPLICEKLRSGTMKLRAES
jgi:hypothetical protein